MTSYDELYTSFLTKTKVDDLDLPNSNEKIYEFIRSAVRDFNNRMSENLQMNDLLEVFDRELTDTEILLLTHFLRKTFLQNQLLYFSSTWQPFQREISLKHYGTQLKALEYLVELEDKYIDSIIRNHEEDYL